MVNLAEPHTESNSKDDNLSIGTAFNLQRKFERLHISRESLSNSQVNSSEIPSFTGLGKRTYRELEKWDIDDEPRNDCSKSAANFLERGSLDQISNQNNDDIQSIKSIKFNRSLLCKASAAVDLIS